MTRKNEGYDFDEKIDLQKKHEKIAMKRFDFDHILLLYDL